MAKTETVKVAQYLVAKDGKTKYLKFEASPKADQATKDLVAKIVAVLGGNILYVNMFDEEFRAKYNIQDFVKGNISAPVGGSANGDSDKVNF
jgi:predicted ATP-grasp superfamily ATP-dependent carboligase